MTAQINDFISIRQILNIVVNFISIYPAAELIVWLKFVCVYGVCLMILTKSIKKSKLWLNVDLKRCFTVLEH